MEEPPIPLVPTKLTPPTPPTSLVARPRLMKALDSVVDDPNRRLALVSAPAGSGKSTLMAAWLEARPEVSCWVQLDEADRDPARFWTYLIAALARALPGLDLALGPLITSAARNPEALISHVATELMRFGKPVLVAIDDYQLAAGPQIDGAVERLLDLAPPNMMLVLGSRLDPGMRLSRMRVRGQLTEIRADDLRFTSEEAEHLLTGRAAGMSQRHVEALCSRTEGWAAGLVLAGLSLGATGDLDQFVATFEGDDRLVVDYLTDEFLEHVGEADRRRLLETSVLEGMCGALVDAVCGTSDGAAWLRSTAETNQLLISLDRTGTWYRYHHLLRDMLRLEASVVLAGHRAELHRRAGGWHMTDGDLTSAVEHLLEAGDLTEAADLIADNATKLLNGGHLFTVLRYLDRLGEVIETHSGCCIVRGWTTFVAGRFGEAEIWLDKASRLDIEGIDAGLITALGTMIQLAKGNVSAALAVASASSKPSDPTHAMVLGGVLVWGGLFDEARPHLRAAADMAASAPDDFAAAVTPIFEAIIELESANPDAAGRLARRTIEFATQRGIDEAAQMALAHSVVGITTDDPAEAAAAVRRGVELARRSPENIMLGYALTAAGDVLSALDHPDGAEMLTEARSVVDRSADPGIVGPYLARAELRHGRKAVVRSVGLVEELTDRELAVLHYLPSELSQRDIANQLYVSLNTVKTHCKAIYRKLGVGDRKAAVHAARELGLL